MLPPKKKTDGLGLTPEASNLHELSHAKPRCPALGLIDGGCHSGSPHITYNVFTTTFNPAAYTPTTPQKKKHYIVTRKMISPSLGHGNSHGKSRQASGLSRPTHFGEPRGIFNEFIHFLLNIDGVPGSRENHFQ